MSIHEEKYRCDFCLTYDFNTLELFPDFRTDVVKKLCPDCADIANSYATAVHKYAERKQAKMAKQIARRLQGINRESAGQRLFFFAKHLKSFFAGEQVKLTMKPEILHKGIEDVAS